MNTHHEPSLASSPATDAGRDAPTPTPDPGVAANLSRAKATEDNAITTATMRSDGPGVASRASVGAGTDAPISIEGKLLWVTAKVHQVHPNSIVVEVPTMQGWHPIGRGCLHGGDAIRFDRMQRSDMGQERTFRCMAWRADELGLA